MAAYTEPIGVLRGHLEEIAQALETAHVNASAHDLVQSTRNVGGTSRPSNLTKRLETALARAQGYLDSSVEPEEVT